MVGWLFWSELPAGERRAGRRLRAHPSRPADPGGPGGPSRRAAAAPVTVPQPACRQPRLARDA